MVDRELSPSAGALEEVRRLAGSSAVIRSVRRLVGGQHAETWRVETARPETTVVVRQFPAADPAGVREQRVLRTLDGLGGLAPVLLGGDLEGRWSEFPTTLISWLDGHPNITPSDPHKWAVQLGHALSVVHAMPPEQLIGLPSVFDRSTGSQEALNGPLAEKVRSRWTEITSAPAVFTHSDYWSGNVVWREETLTGIVDWSGAVGGPRGYDVAWCRLDLVLLLDEQIADVFLSAYEEAAGRAVEEITLWDSWSVARSHDTVESWTPNYAPIGRADLDATELRRLHSQWTERLIQRM